MSIEANPGDQSEIYLAVSEVTVDYKPTETVHTTIVTHANISEEGIIAALAGYYGVTPEAILGESLHKIAEGYSVSVTSIRPDYQPQLLPGSPNLN